MEVSQWEAYYRGGSLSTGPAGPDGCYDQEVKQVWVEFFQIFRNRARVLDVGTGNGVVAAIAAEVSELRNQSLEIHATDLARINPLRDVKLGRERLAGIRFYGGVATERLPFDDATFDGVSGHYALEYTDTEKALHELHRVLKPCGDAQFVLHHSESALIKAAVRSGREHAAVKSSGLYAATWNLLTLDHPTSEIVQQAAMNLRQAIQVVKAAYHDAQRHGSGHIIAVALDAVPKLLTLVGTMTPLELGQQVALAEQELRDSMQRLEDLAHHALTTEQIETVRAQAQSCGFNMIEIAPQYHARHNLIGWLMLLHRQ